MKIKSFEYKRFLSQPEGITLFYVDGAQSICHLYEPIKNSFYIIHGDFKTPYFKTKDDAQKFIKRIKSNEATE